MIVALRLLPALALLAGCTDSSSVTGLVRAGGAPLGGARVRVQATPDLPGRPGFVLTDGDGRFTLPLVPGASKMRTFTVAAGHDGWKNAGRSAAIGDDLVLELPPIPPPAPASGATGDYHFESGALGQFPCFQCHGSLESEWGHSSHALSSIDPLVVEAESAWLAFVDGARDVGARFTEALDGGGARSLIVQADDTPRTECVSCHVPSAARRLDATVGAIAHDAHASRVDLEGVTCDVCHKLRAVDARDPSRPVSDVRLPASASAPQVLFGPFDDALFGETGASYAPSLATGDGCIPCHSNARHLVLEEGGRSFARRVYGEDTYREWRFDPASVTAVVDDALDGSAGGGSDGGSGGGGHDAPASNPGRFTGGDNYAGRALSCPDCHMHDPPPDPSTGEHIADEHLVGDAWQRAATHEDAPLRHPATLHAHGFEGLTPRMLSWATELRATATREGDEVVVHVELENRHTAHDVPTGLPDRNLLLRVLASDGTGALTQTAGPRLPPAAGPRDAGASGALYARTLVAADGSAPVFYAMAVSQSADTRLRPGQIDRLSFRYASVAGSGGGAVSVQVSVAERRRFPAQTRSVVAEIVGDQLTLRVP